MKYLLRKLTLTSMVIILLFLVIVSSTLAWFNSNTTGELNQLNFQAKGNLGLQFSLDDGETWLNQFDGSSIYKAMSDYYEKNGKDLESKLFYTLYPKGNLANSVVYGKNEKKYNYSYKLVTPLATENGFVAKFFNMEQTISGDRHIVFNNLTDYSNVPFSIEDNYNYYDPNDGYIKFTFKVKSERESYLFLNNTYINIENDAMERDMAATSTIRLGFSNDYLTNQYCNLNHVHSSDCKYLKIYEPVDRFTEDLKLNQVQVTKLLEYVHNYDKSTLGEGFYYSSNYSDRLSPKLISQGIIVSKDEYNFKLNSENYLNSYFGDNDTDSSKLYQITDINNAIIKSKCSKVYEANETILMELSQTPKDLTLYIWCEGWDGAAGNFSGLGKFNMSFSFIAIEK